MNGHIDEGARQRTLLLSVEDAANIADDTLRIAHSLVHNGIGGEGCDVDDLVAISCVLDRVSAQIRQASKIANTEWKARGNEADAQEAA